MMVDLANLCWYATHGKTIMEVCLANSTNNLHITILTILAFSLISFLNVFTGFEEFNSM